jgi:hypothetical protein
VRSAGLGLLAPWVTPPWLEGASPLIASSHCTTSCPGGEAGLARVALTPGLRLETEFKRSWVSKPGRVGGTVSAGNPCAPREGPSVGVLSPLASTSLGALRLPGNPSPGDGCVDAGQGFVPLPTPTGRGADGGELTAGQLAGQTQLHQVLSGRGDACSGRQSICGHIPRTGFQRQ